MKRLLAAGLLMVIASSSAWADTITTGGVAQTVFTAGAVSRSCFVQNPQTASAQGIATAESLWIDFTGAAASPSSGTSMEILPGVAWPCQPPSFGAVSIYGATTAHKFNVQKW